MSRYTGTIHCRVRSDLFVFFCRILSSGICILYCIIWTISYRSFLDSVHCISKYISDVFDCHLNKNYQILIIFGAEN